MIEKGSGWWRGWTKATNAANAANAANATNAKKGFRCSTVWSSDSAPCARG